MRQGEIFFNGKSNFELNLRLEKYPPIPMINEEYEEIFVEGRNGSLYVNKGTFQDIKVPFIFTLYSEDIHVDFEKVKSWFIDISDNKLFYGVNDKVFRVKKIILGNFEQEYEMYGFIKVDFIFEPFLTSPEVVEYEFTSKHFKFNYLGNVSSNPTIIIEGSGNIQVILNSDTFIVNSVNGRVTINSELLICVDDNKRNVVNVGKFPTINIGLNDLELVGNVARCKVQYFNKYR